MTRFGRTEITSDLRRRINLMTEEMRVLEEERDRYAQALLQIAAADDGPSGNLAQLALHPLREGDE